MNKADGEHAVEAKAAARELAGAIRLLYPRETLWRPPVLTMSALEGTGLHELWDVVLEHRRVLTEAGSSRHADAPSRWIGCGRWSATRCSTGCCPVPGCAVRADVERRVRDGELTPALAAQEILDAVEHSGKSID